MKNEIAQTWIRLGILFGKTLDKGTLDLMLEAISDLPENLVLKELKYFSMNGDRFPLPVHIREKIKPQVTKLDDARDIANVVIACVSKHGYTNAARARGEMGELAWTTVSRMGGWGHLCETLTNENEGIYRAQIRDYAETVSKKALAGSLDEMPELPNSIKNLLPNFANQE